MLLQESVFFHMGEGAVFEFFELMMMAIVVAFFAYISSQFLKRSRRKEGYEVEKKLSLGYCFFMLSLAVGYGAYMLDRMWRYLYGARFFATYRGIPYTSAMDSDYFLVTFFGMSTGLIFLSYVIEKHVLNRKVVVAAMCAAGLVFTIFLRPLEQLLLPVSEDVVAYLGFGSFAVIAIIFILLIAIYVKIAKMSPPRSDLWNRSVAFIIGACMMVAMLIAGNNQLSKEGGLVALVGPIVTLVSVFIMYYGLSRSE